MIARDRWDLFCRVVDHYGDIGIAWRLARQLERSARAVRLFVDDLASFARIEPRVDPARDAQTIDGVDVRDWGAAASATPAGVAVELLGCRLPDGYLDAMARAVPTPVWIDFEHLSAEPWVDGFHGLPSPHPTRALIKHFFYPGFGEPTGGLLVEPDLDARRAAFVADAVAVDGWRRRIGLDADDGARRLSLFAYDDAPVGALLDALAASSAAGGPRWSVVVPDGVAVAAIDAWLAGAPRSTPPTIARIPFVDQDDYDRLLWTCDVNVVRGEDSFVRAQAAGRPFVWQAYRQPDDAQRPKIGAFLDRFDAVLVPDDREAMRRFWRAWNGDEPDPASAAAGWLATLPRQARAADDWRRRIVSATPLVERLLRYADARRDSP